MNSTPQRQRDRPFQFSLLAMLVTVSIACFVFAQPMIAMAGSASAACLTLGIACVHAALKNRDPGWISGLALGSIIVVIGTAGFVASIIVWFGR